MMSTILLCACLQSNALPVDSATVCFAGGVGGALEPRATLSRLTALRAAARRTCLRIEQKMCLQQSASGSLCTSYGSEL